jgi:hypothetical protein
MPAFNKFQATVLHLASGVHQLQTGSSHVLKVYLSNTAPNAATHAVRADLAEISAGSGYTAGGNTCTLTSGAQTGGTFKLTLADPPTWTATGGSIGPFRYAVLYNDTPTSPADPLLGWWDYGSALTLASGETFTVDLDQAGGTLTLG